MSARIRPLGYVGHLFTTEDYRGWVIREDSDLGFVEWVGVDVTGEELIEMSREDLIAAIDTRENEIDDALANAAARVRGMTAYRRAECWES